METGVGTLLYMAPEFSTDDKYTYKVDVYSYSLIAYQLITSKPIVPNDEQIWRFVYQIPNGKRPDISMINNQFQIDFLEKCWSNNPNERPSFSKIVKFLKYKKFYSTLDVDLNEVNKYLSLFPDQDPISEYPTVEELFYDHNFSAKAALECPDLLKEIKNGNPRLFSNLAHRIKELIKDLFPKKNGIPD